MRGCLELGCSMVESIRTEQPGPPLRKTNAKKPKEGEGGTDTGGNELTIQGGGKGGRSLRSLDRSPL